MAKQSRTDSPAGSADALPQAEDRIEHEAGGARQRPAVERDGILERAAAADEARAIGFPFERTVRPSFEAQHVHRPGAGIARVARAAMADQRAALGQELGFDEQLAERRMREIIARLRQRHFDVAGDVDLADAIAVVDELQDAHLDVVFGRDRDLEPRRDLLVLAVERRDVRQEGRGVALGLAPRRDG